nr:SDR family NAD(P)-dependent oxidoreductase [Bacteriovorax sp. HI3]
MMNQSIATDKPLAVIASSSCSDGYDLARQFAEHGYDIIVAAANPSVVEEAEDFKKLKVDAVSYQLDLSSPEGVEQLYRRIVATGRAVEALVINTGLSDNLEQEQILARKVLHDMADRGFGRILFASCGDQKDADKLCESLKHDVEGTGVTLKALSPDEQVVYFLDEEFIEDKKEATALLH